ncbi:DUF2516 family protein [Georgenia halophila]|uniref:DUF2516 family protein n=1 Tax=Georgenia halophila TaxID=620889 RepID=A0ABP8KZQ3_9MICO
MFGDIQVLLLLVLSLVLFGIEVWALVDLLRRPAAAFLTADKRTKKFWGLLVGGAAVVGFITIPPPLGIGLLGSGFLQFVAVVPAGIYLADVRPAVAPYSRRRPPRGGGSW